MASRLFLWWRLAEDALRPLTSPKTDVATSDERVDSILRESAIVARAQDIGGSLYDAWFDSRTRAVAYAWRAALLPDAAVSKVAIATAIALVAALTALGLTWISALTAR
jgi:hypothetical protein